MYLPEPVKAKILEFVNRYPFPITNDEDASAWTHRLCQQLKYSFPNDSWGHKSAGPGRPHSADVIATQSPFLGWDIISSAGSPDAKLNLNAESKDLANPPDGPQIFEQVVAQDYLQGTIPVPEPEPEPEPDNNIEVQLLMQILAELKTHTEIFKAMAAGMAALPTQINETISKGIKIRF